MGPPARVSLIRRRTVLCVPLVAACGLGVALAHSPASAAGAETTDLISATPGGSVGSVGGHWASISGDGRHVAFASSSDDLVPGDTNNATDVFVRDTTTGTTTRVSVATGGAQAANGGRQPAISKNGRFVAFDSFSPDLVGGDANASRDVFVHDRQTGTTERVSLTDIGGEINDDAGYASISGDGTRIAFSSGATNILPGLPGRAEIFVRDTVAGTTSRLTRDVVGSDPNEDSFTPQISADGGHVTFQSRASDLVPFDTNGKDDVFVRDLATNQMERVSVTSAGLQGDKQAWKPSISDDGTKIAFLTSAALVAGDTNAFPDVFVRDTTASTTTRHSLGVGGSELTEGSGSPAISGDGKVVGFTTNDPGVVPGDGNAETDLFVHDSASGAVRRVSVAADGSEGNGFTYETRSALSTDGSRVAFYTQADNLVPADGNGTNDTFLRRPADPPPPLGPGTATGSGGGAGAAPHAQAGQGSGAEAAASKAKLARYTCGGKRATIVGTKGNDMIRGTRRADVIVALGGRDRIIARGGNDTICAGPGHDRVFAGSGRDRVFGQAGNDLIKGQGGGDILKGQRGRDRIFGNAGRDRLFGNAGRDLLIGGRARDIGVGGAGKDKFHSVEVRRA